jgi:PIN domain nuclease of toxin-antitoxin system
VNLLLDTQVFLWWDRQDKALNVDTRAVIADPTNQNFVSAASIWEIAIKRQFKKLDYRG